MKTTILSTLFTFLIANLAAQGLVFEAKDWESAMKMAKKEKKAIYVDCYTTWCGPCKWMEKNTFPDEAVGEFYNKNFVSLKLDMEKGEGKELAKTWQISAYPTSMFFDAGGNAIHKAVGAMEAPGLIATGTIALDPEKQVYSQMKKFADGNREPEFLYDHAMALAMANLNFREVADEYIKTQNDGDWMNEKNWKFIRGLVTSSDNPLFRKVTENWDAFEKVGGDDIGIYVKYVLNNDIYRTVGSGDESALQKLQTKFQSLVPEAAEELYAKAQYLFYKSNPELSHVYAVSYFDNFCNDWDELNNVSWDYFEQFEDKQYLEKALNWANRSVEIEENYYNTDTQANILAKLGRTEEAIKATERSIENGKAAGEETRETEDLLKKLKGGQ